MIDIAKQAKELMIAGIIVLCVIGVVIWIATDFWLRVLGFACAAVVFFSLVENYKVWRRWR